MRLFALLCRVTFVFNLLFLTAAILSFTALDERNPDFFAIVLIGYLLSVFLFNPLTNLITLILLLIKKQPHVAVPKWLLWSNFIFLLFQFTYIFLINDSVHY